MIQKVIDELNQKDHTEFHQSLCDETKRLVKSSRSVMSGSYSDWDLQDQVYRGERETDQEDRDQERKGKPTKMVVPNTFAQVMTFTSFLFLMYNQNPKFFELQPTGDEDYGTKWRDSEAVLNRDLKKNEWNRLLFQHLLDTSRFGPAVLECGWTRKLSRIFVQPETPVVQNIDSQQVSILPGSQWHEVVKYEGNEIKNVSPYRFFPDTAHPLVDFQKGKFCAVEEDFSWETLKDLEVAGEVAGIEHIENLPNSTTELGGAIRSASFSDLNKYRSDFNKDREKCSVLVTKCQRWIVPAHYKFGPKDEKLGPEEHPVLYEVWLANHNRVIKCESANAWHNEFKWTVAQFTPDMHRTITMGLADLVYRLQDVITWFVNSHISSVRRVMQNRLLINPQAIDTRSLDGEGDIYLRKGMSVPLDRAVMQLKVQDVTGGHMGDVELLGRLMEIVTGVNGNAMGQYNSGRRSAQEARVVTAGAAGRMKMHGHLIWDTSIGRLGRLMLSNSRQSLSFESFQRAIGSRDPQLQARFTEFRGGDDAFLRAQEIAAGDDYFTFDSTLASEKGFIAQSLQELLVAIMSNPVAAQQLDLDPRAMLEEIQYLRGAGSISRFSLSKRVASGQATPLPPAVVPDPAAAQAV